MIHSPAEITTTLLTQGSGCPFTDSQASMAWPLYTSGIPDGEGVQDNAAATYDTSGVIQSRTLNLNVVEALGVQIKVRGTNYGDTRRKLQAVITWLDAIKRTPISVRTEEGIVCQYRLDNYQRTSTIMSMGSDLRRRSLLSVNYLLHLVQLS